MRAVSPAMARCQCSLLCVFIASLSLATASPALPNLALLQRQAPAQAPLVNFQVSEPVLIPAGTDGKQCSQLLMDHTFGNSYGVPFVGNYTPPSCSFNRVAINFTVSTTGRQFDRLGIMYLDGVEVFRTSTAEPTPAGIVWSYVKEMEQYNALWNASQEIVFALPNVVNDVYTGPLEATLTAIFYTIPGSPPTADKILSISGTQSGAYGTAFSVPDGGPASVSLEFPRNVERAVVSLSACGQQAEEFWYTNVLSEDIDTFVGTAGELYGYSPFREVQLFIDNNLAGVYWPFPVVFTGGVVPGFWRPIVGIDAFDLRQHEIDITPWLGQLCDGESHDFEIRVVGLDDNDLSETVGSFWLVTGTVFLYLDKSGTTTTGLSPSYLQKTPHVDVAKYITHNSTGANETLTTVTNVTRSLLISSNVTTSSGTRLVSWTQKLAYSNRNLLSDQGITQHTNQSTDGEDHASASGYSNAYSYPITVNSSFSQTQPSANAPATVSINGTITHGLDFTVLGPAVFPKGTQNVRNTDTSVVFSLAGLQTEGNFSLAADSSSEQIGSKISTIQSAKAEYLSAGNASYSFGTTSQDFDFSDVDSAGKTYELYHRSVEAVNSTIVQDKETFVGLAFSIPIGKPDLSSTGPEASLPPPGLSVKAVLGRGPGSSKAQLGGVP